MPELFGLIARLLVDDQPLDEYGQMDDGSSTSCWVISEENKSFSVELANLSEYEYITFKMFVDGMHIDTFLLENGAWKVRNNFKVSSTACKPLMFSKIITTDNEDESISAVELESLGTIEFHAWWVDKLMQKNSIQGWSQTLPTKPVFERAKLQASHRISTGPATPREQSIGQVVRAVMPENGPIAKFIIRYRSREILLANGVLETPDEQSVFMVPLVSVNTPVNYPNTLKRQQTANDERSQRARKLRRTSSSLLEVKREAPSTSGRTPLSDVTPSQELTALREQVKSMQNRLNQLERERSVKVELSQRAPKRECLSQDRPVKSEFVKKEEPLTQSFRPVKRENSPIRLPFPSGQAFDLTND